jgi:hypothetical protein
LVFIPFYEGHHELIQEKFGLTINKNQLKLSSNLQLRVVSIIYSKMIAGDGKGMIKKNGED